MSLLTTPSDIISKIMSFLDNRVNARLIRICKYIHLHGKEFGYASYINANLSTNMGVFIRRFCQHSHYIKTVEIYGIDNPHIWIPHFVERLIFEQCSITGYVNPGKQAHVTKSLKLTDYHRYKFKTILRVNWLCFPNLEELELYVYDVDLTGIEQCQKLKSVKIDTCILVT
jgi:hypothetical protein